MPLNKLQVINIYFVFCVVYAHVYVWVYKLRSESIPVVGFATFIDPSGSVTIELVQFNPMVKMLLVRYRLF